MMKFFIFCLFPAIFMAKAEIVDELPENQRNSQVLDEAQITNIVSRLLETFRLEIKTEIGNLESEIESLNTKLQQVEDEVQTQPIMEMPGLLGQKGQKGEPGRISRRIGSKVTSEKQRSKGETTETEKPGQFLLHIKQTLGILAHPKSCHEIDQSSTSQSKQKIYPTGRDEPGVEVLCDFDTDGGSWTIIQKRSSGPKDEFYREWAEYEEGFGSVDGNYWIGLKTIYALTKDRDHELRIDLWDFEDEHVYAKYSKFAISDSSDDYRLWIGGYSGTAGDAFGRRFGTRLDQQWYGMKFSTKDRDNDKNGRGNCAEDQRGGWWYDNCGWSNLNGFYYERGEIQDPPHSGMYFLARKNSVRSLRQVEIRIRRRW